MVRRSAVAFTFGLLFAFSSNAWPEDSKSPSGELSPQGVSSASSPSVAPKPADQSKFETPATLIDDKHLESILGKEVRTGSGETLGNVTDVLVDSDGTVRAAIIDFGGFLGVGVRKIAIAWSALRFAPMKAGIGAVLDMDKDQLRVAPEFRTGEPIVVLGASPKSDTQPSPQGQ